MHTGVARCGRGKRRTSLSPRPAAHVGSRLAVILGPKSMSDPVSFPSMYVFAGIYRPRPTGSPNSRPQSAARSSILSDISISHPKTQFKRYVPFARTTSNDLRYIAPSLASTTDMTTTATRKFSSLNHPTPSAMVRLGILSRRGIPERLLAFNPKRPSSLNRPLYSACTPLYESIIAITNLVISSDIG